MGRGRCLQSVRLGPRRLGAGGGRGRLRPGSARLLRSRRLRERDAPCSDCGIATAPEGWFRSPPWEWYMVQDHVWAAAGMGSTDGFLCIGCLEARLGRSLGAADFRSDMVMNSTDPAWAGHSWWYRTPRPAGPVPARGGA